MFRPPCQVNSTEADEHRIGAFLPFSGLAPGSEDADGTSQELPIRTFAEWNDPIPGFMEMDLVAHCGDLAAGSFVHTLTLTDISTGWTGCLPLLVREASLVVEAVDGLRGSLPFRLSPASM